ncbi:hypothetical protein ACFE04_025549 [Oxalis oulophora]
MENDLQQLGLTVSVNQSKGRCLVTTKDFNPGEVIISQEPYVCVPNTNTSPVNKCDGCFASTSSIKKCSACHTVYYCGSSCQKLEWKLHRLECLALCTLPKDKRKSLTPTIRLMLKLYLRRKLQNDNIIPRTDMDNYDLVVALVSHMSKIDEKQLVLYAQMANLVNSILQLPENSIKEIAENFSKFACNAHTICDSELKPLGTGLYPVISIINHSCLPNAVLVFHGRSAVVRAVQHIPKGSEQGKANSYYSLAFYKVLISYIETAGSTSTRQKALQEQYLFTCDCPRCIKLGQLDDIKESAILEGYRCKEDKCDGFLLRDSGMVKYWCILLCSFVTGRSSSDKGFICQQCGLSRSKEEIKRLASEIKAISDKAQVSLHSTNNQEAVSIYKKIEKLQRKLCHPFSTTLMQTREKLLKLLMELEDWREALKYCRLTILVYHRVYPGIHPLPGLQYYTCGKLEWLLGNTEEAVKFLTMAMDVLRITHGTDTPFMKELLMKLEEARAEASYKLRLRDD